MKTLIACLLLFAIISHVYSWRFFDLGRVNEGNLAYLNEQNLLDDDRNFTRWLTQNLDHCDPDNLDTWQQKYFVNDEFFDTTERNIAFLLIAGEWTATDNWMTEGNWNVIGQKFNAILFQLEHRYYGESLPTEDASVENLKYLTSEQALGDVAVFIETMNEEYELASDVKWIVFGGSYPGSLAAWARMKYPDLIYGAVGSSGPLLALADFQDFYEVVSDDLRSISEECNSAVKSGTSQLDILLQDVDGRANLTNMFNLCVSLEESAQNDEDIALLYYSLAGNFAGIAQYNRDNRNSTRGTKLGNITLDTICAIMTDESVPDEITRLANVNFLILDATGQTCLAYNYLDMVQELGNSSWEIATGGRQWQYQTCNEFGFYQTSSKEPHIFGNKFPIDHYYQRCMDIFGDDFNASYIEAAVDRTNAIYGGYDIEVTNVVFIHGSLDPWHALGITESTNQDAPAIYINGSAHCADTYPETDDDLPQLKAARAEILQFVESWLDL